PGTAATCAGGDALAATGSLVHATGTSFSPGGGGTLDGGSTAPGGVETLLLLSPLVSFDDIPPLLDAPTAVRETEAALITLEGLPGDTAFLYAGLDLGYGPLSGPKGVFVPSGTLLGPFPLGAFPGSGQIPLPFIGPDLAGLDGFAITLQGFTGPGVGFVLTNPHSLLLLDQDL
ncbi:MAG: hypothetical protein ACYTG2_19190, partial [Planctomycetota bacterium]